MERNIDEDMHMMCIWESRAEVEVKGGVVVLIEMTLTIFPRFLASTQDCEHDTVRSNSWLWLSGAQLSDREVMTPPCHVVPYCTYHVRLMRAHHQSAHQCIG